MIKYLFKFLWEYRHDHKVLGASLKAFLCHPYFSKHLKGRHNYGLLWFSQVLSMLSFGFGLGLLFQREWANGTWLILLGIWNMATFMNAWLFQTCWLLWEKQELEKKSDAGV